MSNLFDGLQSTTFDVVNGVFGFDLTCTLKAPGSSEMSSRCLFKDPNASDKIMPLGPEYMPLNPEIEYKEGDMPGLYEAVKDGTYEEEVTINGVLTYYVRTVDKLYDGKTYRAKLQLNNE